MISDFVQKDRTGTIQDYSFNALEISEIRNITVSDSINYLTDEYHKDQNVLIGRIELAIKMTNDLLKNEQGRRNPKQ